jgi:hypothetical protein
VVGERERFEKGQRMPEQGVIPGRCFIRAFLERGNSFGQVSMSSSLSMSARRAWK